MKRSSIPCLVLSLLGAPALNAGVYDGSVVDGLSTAMIVHPIGFDGSGGPLPVAVCIRPGDEILTPTVQAVIALWNDLTPTTSNCTGCITSEEFVTLPPEEPPQIFSLRRTVTHELGHCGNGLGHTNWMETSSSNAKDATSILRCNSPPCPPEAIPGDFDDLALPNPPANPAARIVHWFKDDPSNPTNANNPVVIDPTVIDESTFTRRRIDLPSGHSWPANVNSVAAASYGFPDTHSPLYSMVFGGENLVSLTADDVATVQFAQAGVDKIAGTADDYSTQFALVADCAMADIEFQWVPASDPALGEDSTGVCVATVEPVPGLPAPAQHFRIAPVMSMVRVKVNSEIRWREFEPIFVDGFESGDTSAWSMTIP